MSEATTIEQVGIDRKKYLETLFPKSNPYSKIQILNRQTNPVNILDIENRVKLPEPTRAQTVIKKGTEFFWGPERPDAKNPLLAQMTDEWTDGLNFLPAVGVAAKGVSKIPRLIDNYRDAKNTRNVIRMKNLYHGSIFPNLEKLSVNPGKYAPDKFGVDSAKRGLFTTPSEKVAANMYGKSELTNVATKFADRGLKSGKVKLNYTIPAADVVRGGKTFSLVKPNKQFIKDLKARIKAVRKENADDLADRDYVFTRDPFTVRQGELVELEALLQTVTRTKGTNYTFGLTEKQLKFFTDRGFTNIYQVNGSHPEGVVIALKSVKPSKMTIRKPKYYMSKKELKDKDNILFEKTKFKGEEGS